MRKCCQKKGNLLPKIIMLKKIIFQNIKYILVIFINLLILHIYAQNIRYVKENGIGDGTSWQNASGNLQAMIDSSCTIGGEIWIAKGIYKPTQDLAYTNYYGDSTTPRHRSFFIAGNVRLYGGFPDTANPGMQNRNWENNPTILSGDIGVVGEHSDNVYNVIIAYPSGDSLVIDGFTISDGYADVADDDYTYFNGRRIALNNGGGLYIQNNNPTIVSIKNNVITNNTAIDEGSGVYVINSNDGVLIFMNNEVSYNNLYIPDGYQSCTGGGMTLAISVAGDSSESAIVKYNTFEHNKAETAGGLMVCINSATGYPGASVLAKATISDNVIRNNWAMYDGGGIFVAEIPSSSDNYFTGSCSSIDHNIITCNSAEQGGGLFILHNCRAGNWDGEAGSITSVSNNVITNNNASLKGGGLYLDVFADHSNATVSLSEIYLTNNTVACNTAGNSGGGLFLKRTGMIGDSYCYIRNSIFAKNIGNSGISSLRQNIDVEESPFFLIDYSLFDTPLLSVFDQGHNLPEVNPLFVNFQNADFSLLVNSPGIGGGNVQFYDPDSVPNLSYIQTDILGNARYFNNFIDVGAYQLLDTNFILHILVNNLAASLNESNFDQYEILLEYTDSIFIQAEILAPNSIITPSDIGLKPVNTGLNVFPIRVTFENGIIKEYILNVYIATPDAIAESIIDQLKIYPNPTSGFINIDSSIIINSLSIFSMDGQLIKYIKSSSHMVDLSDLKSGLYLIHISTSHGEAIQKIVIF